MFAVVSLVAGFALGVGVMWLVFGRGRAADRRSVQKSAEAREMVERCASYLVMGVQPAVDGDLTVELDLDQAGVLKELATAFERVIAAFRKVAWNVRHTFGTVTRHTEAVAEAVGRFGAMVRLNRGLMEDARRAMRDLDEVRETVAAGMAQTREAADRSVSSVDVGSAALGGMLTTLQGIRANMVGAMRQLRALSDAALAADEKVGTVLVISGKAEIVADRMRILASGLGEGYEEVADEMRAVADDMGRGLGDLQEAMGASREEIVRVGAQVEKVGGGMAEMLQAGDSARAAFSGIAASVQTLSEFVGKVGGLTGELERAALALGEVVQQATVMFGSVGEIAEASDTSTRALQEAVGQLNEAIRGVRTEVAGVSGAA